MINGLRVLGIVPARAGSKGLPGKNHRILNGKPLVKYAILAGNESSYIDDVVLTSDCPKCINIATSLDVMVPFIRPPHLSEDKVSSADVIEHVIAHLAQESITYDLFVLLEPTSPLRDAADVDSALEFLVASGKKSLVSVCMAEDQHPNFMFRVEENDTLTTWGNEQFKPVRRQDLLPAYFLDGSVYISHINTFLLKRTFCHEDTVAFKVPKWKSLEVDDIVDFVCVEAILKQKIVILENQNA